MTSVSTDDPTISVVINTINRANELSRTLDSFRWQTYRDKFEVIVVNGPSTDHTQQVIDSWIPQIRAAVCPAANLSASRNIGIRISSADVVAFVDDDSIPEPEWLEQIGRAYRDPEVAAVGGRVYDHTGVQFQSEYCMVDRFGNATMAPSRPMPQRSFPSSFVFPHLLGTNSSFRRDVLIQIGGFDEEFDYYLDETDVCLRVVDKGYLIRQLDCAYVHHKFAPSAIRSEKRVLRNYYSVLKNKIYFCRKHSHDYCQPSKILEEQERFIERWRLEINSLAKNGLLTTTDAETFERDVQRAIATGHSAPIPKSPPPSICPTTQGSSILPFPTYTPKGGALTIVLVTQEYPPGQHGRIATINKDVAVALASVGHRVHVICLSSDGDRVEFDAGTWVHRLRPRNVEQPPPVLGREIPADIWNWSATALNEAQRIAAHRPIDIVEAWGSQGIAFLLDGRWPQLASLQTSLEFWLASHPELLADRKWMMLSDSSSPNSERELMQGVNEKSSANKAPSDEKLHW